MAEVQQAPGFGVQLPDGFRPANVWVSNNIAWLDDIQTFYRERSAIEKDYANRLSVLAGKYFDKKARKSAGLSVGDTPAMTPGSLESASVTTWTTQLNTLESRAKEHDKYGNDLVTKVADPLKHLTGRFEDLRKRHVEFSEMLEKERDSSYADLRKVKTKYDSVCSDVESKRKKSESSSERSKAASAYQQQLLEMNNMKNTYLIAINVTNKQKEKYYQEYVPDLMDSLQDLAEFKTSKINGLWTLASQLEAGLLQQSSGFIDRQTQEIARNVPNLDSLMYIQHNQGGFQEPGDRVFEPSPVWHDDGTMVIDESAKIFLRNVLNRSKGQLGELRREADKKRRDVEGTKRLKQRVMSGAERSDEIVLVNTLFAQQEDLHAVDRKRITAEIETVTITTVVGDVTIGAKSHNFKSQTFKIPTNCDLCGDRIWGLSAKGFDCRDCGYTCHSKCELKVPAECPGESTKEQRKTLKQQRQDAANTLLKPTTQAGHVAELPALGRTNTMTSLSSGYAASAHRSISGAMSPTEDVPPDTPATSRPVSSVSTGGGGAAAAAGASGRKHRIVAPPPAAFVSGLPANSTVSSNGTSNEPKGMMLYAFDANGEGEISVPEGREVVILEADSGSGWVKIRFHHDEGVVPATYLEVLPTSTPAPISAIAPQNTGQSFSNVSTYSNSGSSINTTGAPKKKGPAVAPRRGAKKLKYAEALYAYEAQSSTEHSMAEGDRFLLVQDDQGDGWVEVEKAGATKSVPASYVQIV